MNEWNNKTDFEINRAVATARGIKTMHKDGLSKYKDSPSGFMIVTREPFQHYPFDPVNNPCHAWPIIVENKLWIQPDCVGDGFWHSYDDDFSAKDENPLRAAMIVYLEMSGVKP